MDQKLVSQTAHTLLLFTGVWQSYYGGEQSFFSKQRPIHDVAELEIE
jgi:hypothetical protein